MRFKRHRPSFTERVIGEVRNGRSIFSAIFSSTWNSLGSFLGSYDAVDPRNVAMRGVIGRPTTAADLATSTPYLRNLCRNYERNNAAVRAMTEGIVANVVGSGIALEPDTGVPETDDKLREAWNEYIRDCSIDGLSLYELETMAMRDTVVAGEGLWRFVIDNARLKAGKIPLCILPLEAEWLGDSGMTVVGQTQGYVGGVKLDQYGRPVSFSLYSPGGSYEEVPAANISHIFERRRALQIRGEPWFAPIVTTLRQEKDLVTSELEAAKNTAGFAAAITTNGGLPADLDEKGEPTRDIRLGSVLELQQGEDIKLLNHTRPSQQIAPFRDMLRGDMAGALRIGRRWIDRDISGANYSSMRADMLDNERLLGPVREWFGHQTAGRLYKRVLPYLAIKAGVAVPRDNYRLVPDGQPYVDPLKDAQAAAMAIEFGLSTFEAEIGKRGGDYKQVWAKLAEEKAMLDKLGIVLHSPSGVPFGDEAAMAEGADNSNGPKSKTKPKGQPGSSSEAHVKNEERVDMTQLVRDVMGEQRKIAEANKPHIEMHTHNHLPAPVTNVNNTVQPGVVNIRQEAQSPPIVNVPPSHTTVVNEIRQDSQPAPVVNVSVQSATPDITVNPSTAVVEVKNEIENVFPSRTIKATPQADGSTILKPIG